MEDIVTQDAIAALKAELSDLGEIEVTLTPAPSKMGDENRWERLCVVKQFKGKEYAFAIRIYADTDPTLHAPAIRGWWEEIAAILNRFDNRQEDAVNA